jgi:MFS family permease
MSKFKYIIIFALVYFFSPNGLSSLPNLSISYLLKDVFKLTATQAAYFGAISILGWAIKPLWGLISDLFPIKGSRRRNYLILTSLVASFCWLILALTSNYNVWLLLLILTFSSFAYAFQDVVTDAYMVEIGKKENKLREFQSVQWLAVSLARIITGVAGGLAAAKLSYQTTFGIAFFFPLIVAIISYLLLKNEPETIMRFQEFKKVFKVAFLNKDFLLVTLVLFLWNFLPSFGTPFFYYMVDELKFSKILIGTLNSISAIGSAIGAMIFGSFLRRVNFKKLFIFSILISSIGTFFVLIYLTDFVKNNHTLAVVLSIFDRIVFGALGMIAFLTMLTLAAQKTESLVAGSMFAFVTSIINLASMGSGFLGGYLYSKIGLGPLIVVSAVTSLIILIFVPFLKLEDNEENSGSE